MMASDIEIVNLSNFEKIQNFLNDSAYKEILENSENFNTRLCIERRLRMPFLDPQTGVAQTHCALFMKQKQRMPGFRDGQIYTYPSARWRKPKRQYLLNHHHSYRAYQYREQHHQSTGSVRDQYQTESAAIAAADGNSMSASGDNDSKDSHSNAEKGWFHEDMDMSHYHHVEDFEEDFDSDNEFDESYSSRGKRKRGSRSSRRSNIATEGTTPKRGRKGGGSSRRRTLGPDGEVIDRRRRGASNIAPPTAAINDETSQSLPMPPSTVTSCSTSSTTTTLDKTQNDAGVPNNDAASSSTIASTSTAPSSSSSSSVVAATTAAPSSASAVVVAAATAAAPPVVPAVSSPASPKKEAKSKLRADRVIAESQHYCDFCLGDQSLNKKTNLPEELVSCSDCGRAGHPFCLQFTPNMIISVKRYRWQCIECKYCSICGTSDNDDQLLFCDDCDRGYHMYCLSPPLIAPPEGSWSCKLCMEEFHKDDK